MPASQGDSPVEANQGFSGNDMHDKIVIAIGSLVRSMEKGNRHAPLRVPVPRVSQGCRSSGPNEDRAAGMPQMRQQKIGKTIERHRIPCDGFEELPADNASRLR